eukprot:NODE_800_length_2758_cov_2.244014.p1 GENE.NODE_800_length_2758_cov_2.244014~~NODE_800_length_2758_cov_2.244014.p1  ORF type:complete len:728 (+),score=212.78 NODE_800_length_2758_cov_2.244014:301-2484(+)
MDSGEVGTQASAMQTSAELRPLRAASAGWPVDRWDLREGEAPPSREEFANAYDWSAPLLLSAGFAGDASAAGVAPASTAAFFHGLSELLASIEVEYTVSAGRDIGPGFALLYLSNLGRDVLGLCEDVFPDASIEHPSHILTPAVLGEDVAADGALPATLRPQSDRTLLVQGAGTVTLLRRDPQTWCGWDLLVDGWRCWRLYAPDTPLTELGAAVVEGDLGAGAAERGGPCTAEGFYEVIQEAGQVVLVPPGWWYQTMSPRQSISVLGHHLPHSALPRVTASVAASICGYSRAHPCGPQLEPLFELQALAADIAAGRPADDRPRRTCVQAPFPPPPAGTTPDCQLPFTQRLEALLFRECWTLPSSSVCVPEDAALWDNLELECFARWGGFLKPQRRYPVVAPAFEILEHAWEAAARTMAVTPQPSVLDADYPHVIWSFWSQGAERLPRFRRLCMASWAAQNPRWCVMLLDADSVLRYVDRAELPEHWERLGHEHAADAVRLALLARYGGVWADVGSLCLRPLESWAWDEVASGRGLAAFYFAMHGKTPGESREYVENWFLAARRAHPLVVAWHNLFLRAWAGKTNCEAVAEDSLFEGVDLAHLDFNQRRYLTMHVCFKKLIDESEELHRIWADEMLLLRADDGVLRWMAGIDSREDAIREWVYVTDTAWVDGLVVDAPLVKFIGKFARALDVQPLQHLLRRENNIQRLLLHALAPQALPAPNCFEAVD